VARHESYKEYGACCSTLRKSSAMHVTRHSQIIDPRLLDQLWTLYVRAYLPMAQDTVTHEMLERPEFVAQLTLETNRAWVVWEGSRPVAMTLIATDVRSTRWLSELYFEKHFPERMKAGQVHYIVWAVVDPDHVATGAVIHLGKQALAAEAQDGALLVFDTPESNQPKETGGSAELLIRLARMVSEAELLPITVQRYFAIDFGQGRSPLYAAGTAGAELGSGTAGAELGYGDERVLSG